jgi:hypothetical protein
MSCTSYAGAFSSWYSTRGTDLQQHVFGVEHGHTIECMDPVFGPFFERAWGDVFGSHEQRDTLADAPTACKLWLYLFLPVSLYTLFVIVLSYLQKPYLSRVATEQTNQHQVQQPLLPIQSPV